MQEVQSSDSQAPSEIAQAEAAVTAKWQMPDWMPQPVVDAWNLVGDYPILGFFLIVVVSYVVARLVVFLIGRSLQRLAAQTKTDLDDKIAALIQRPIFNTFFFAGLAIAIHNLARSLEVPDGPLNFTVRILMTFVVLSWLGALFPISRLLLDSLGRHQEKFHMVEERTLPLFEITMKLLLLAGGSYAVLEVWGIDPTAWLASAGVLGIAVGFAARDSLANLFAGFFIVTDAPYKLGDFIVLDSGERGRVINVGIRSTRLETRDDVEITIPNAAIANSKIVNESGGKWERERIRVKVGVAYGSDLDQVCAVLKKIPTAHKEICDDPAPRVRLRGFGDSSVDFELLCWIDEPVLRGRLLHEMYMEIYKTFDKEGIEIPYMKHDVYIHKMPEKAS